MDRSLDQSPINQSATPEEGLDLDELPKSEQITIDIGVEINCRIDKIPEIIRSYNNWSKQWEN